VTRSRLLPALLVGLLAMGAVLVVAVVRAGARPDLPAVTRPAASRPVRVPAAEVLHDWDARRAAAYDAGSARRLRALYVPGSAAGRADVGVLRGYRARGMRVTGLRMQVLALRVLTAGPGVLRVRVADRVSGAVVLDGRRRVLLPRDQVSRRVLTLRRGPDGAWRMAGVRPLR
jgi:hypothetical protein